MIVTCVCLLNSRVKTALAVLVKLAESERTGGIYPVSHWSRRCRPFKFPGIRSRIRMQNKENHNMNTSAEKETGFE